MAGTEQFDFIVFATSLRGLSRQEQRDKVRDELGRIRAIVVREPSWKFKQQIHVRRVERLSRYLAGEEVSMELTPSEIEAYALLSSPPPQPARPAAAAAAAATPASSAPAAGDPAPRPTTPAPSVPSEASLDMADRRGSKRIQMRTRVRIRRQSDGSKEMLEPTNVSRGGIAFRGSKVYALYEKIFVNMHYQPNQPETAGLETRGMIVRVVPLRNMQLYDYGVKFLD